jgi:hypothetical protein
MAKKDETKELVNWEDKLAAEAKDIAATERPSVSRISIRSGILSYEDTPYPNNTLDCIVVNHAFENRWYDTDWDPDNIVPPRCFALAVAKELLAPHENADPQAKNCSECPKSKWGSDPRPNSKGKACGEVRRLALIPYMPDITAEAITQAEIALMNVPVTSVKNWSNYVNRVGAAYRRPPWAVITTIKVVPDQKTQFKVQFDSPKALDDELLAALNAKRDSVVPALMQPYEKPAEPEEGVAPDSDKY